jgi:hypothetical protein
MKILLMMLVLAGPAAAQWGAGESSAAGELLKARAEVVNIGGAPLLQLLAARDKASQPVTLGGKDFLATVVFDANWDAWFSLKPACGPLGAGAWKESDLAAGAVYRYGGLEFKIKETDGVVAIEGPGRDRTEIAVSSLFDRLYEESMKITFGDAVTYAAFRNLEPLSESEGTVTMRVDQDGVYYFSLTPDEQVAETPRWLLAVNGVLYGLRVQDGSLLFVSKKTNGLKPVLAWERYR